MGNLNEALAAGIRGKLYYESDDRIPKTLALGLGIQLAALAINGVVLLPTIVFRAGDAEDLISWAVFASVLACGISAILQSMRVGQIGSGYALTHVSSAIFIAVCAEALLRGGAGAARHIGRHHGPCSSGAFYASLAVA